MNFKKTFAIGLFLLLLISPLIHAEDIVDTIKGIDDKKEAIEGNLSKSYLTEEWTKVLREKKSTSWIYEISPVFKFLLGQEFDLSWSFVAAFLLWTLIFGFAYPPLKYLFKEQFVALGVSILLASITLQLVGDQYIQIMSSVVKTAWHGLVTGIVFIVIIIILFRLSKQIVATWKKKMEEKRLNLLEKNQQEDVSGIRAIKRGAESMKKGSDRFK